MRERDVEHLQLGGRVGERVLGDVCGQETEVARLVAPEENWKIIVRRVAPAAPVRRDRHDHAAVARRNTVDVGHHLRSRVGPHHPAALIMPAFDHPIHRDRLVAMHQMRRHAHIGRRQPIAASRDAKRNRQSRPQTLGSAARGRATHGPTRNSVAALGRDRRLHAIDPRFP